MKNDSVNRYKQVEINYNTIDTNYQLSYDPVKEYDHEIKDFSSVLSEDAKILVVGGIPSETIFFSSLVSDVINIDISQKMLNEVENSVRKSVCIKANILDFKGGPFNAIWACRSLIHVPQYDLDKTLKNIYSLLIEGGCIGAIFFTCDESTLEQELPETNTDQEDIIYYRNLYSVDILKKAFIKSGFLISTVIEQTDADGEKSVYIRAIKS